MKCRLKYKNKRPWKVKGGDQKQFLKVEILEERQLLVTRKTRRSPWVAEG